MSFERNRADRALRHLLNIGRLADQKRKFPVEGSGFLGSCRYDFMPMRKRQK
jgi:hypothetical protein